MWPGLAGCLDCAIRCHCRDHDRAVPAQLLNTADSLNPYFGSTASELLAMQGIVKKDVVDHNFKARLSCELVCEKLSDLSETNESDSRAHSVVSSKRQTSSMSASFALREIRKHNRFDSSRHPHQPVTGRLGASLSSHVNL
jgi:hypothetical protein